MSFAANSRDDRLKVFGKCIQPSGSRNLAKGGASHEVHCVILLGAVLSVRGSEEENEMAFFDAHNFKKATFARRFLNSRELPSPHSISKNKSSSNGSGSATHTDGGSRGEPRGAPLRPSEIVL